MKNFKNLACRFGLSRAKKIATCFLVACLFLVASVTGVKAQTVSFPDFTEQENKKINQYIPLVEKYGEQKIGEKTLLVNSEKKLTLSVSKNLRGSIIYIGFIRSDIKKHQRSTYYNCYLKPNDDFNGSYNIINGKPLIHLSTDSINGSRKTLGDFINSKFMDEQEINENQKHTMKMKELKIQARKKLYEAVLINGPEKNSDIISFRVTDEDDEIVCNISNNTYAIWYSVKFNHINLIDLEEHSEYLEKEQEKLLNKFLEKDILSEAEISKRAISKQKLLNPNNEDKKFLYKNEFMYIYKHKEHKLMDLSTGKQFTFNEDRFGKNDNESNRYWYIMDNFHKTANCKEMKD